MKGGGVKEAAKMLSGLDPRSQERILSDIAKKDQKMAELLRKNLVTMEDLKAMTVEMIRSLLNDISTDDLGLALRNTSSELIDHFVNNVSRGIAREINDILNGPKRPLSQVEEAQGKVLEVVRNKMKKGEIVLNKQGGEEYV